MTFRAIFANCFIFIHKVIHLLRKTLISYTEDLNPPLHTEIQRTNLPSMVRNSGLLSKVKGCTQIADIVAFLLNAIGFG